MTSNLKIRRGWTTPATPATSRDVAAAPVLPRALPPLRDGQVYLVAGSGVFHDRHCDRLLIAFEAGKTVTIEPAAAVGKRTMCAACGKLAGSSNQVVAP